MSDWVLEISDFLPDDVCETLISRFEKDTNQKRGRIGGSGGPHVDLSIKNSIDLYISDKNDWIDMDDVLYDYVREGMRQYIQHVKKEVNPHFKLPIDVSDKGYQIQKYQPNVGHYTWHDDFCIEMSRDNLTRLTRMLTFIFYLNDVADGGETEFYNGRKVRPSRGKFMMFPSTTTFTHRANVPISGYKYICTGWLYTRKY